MSTRHANITELPISPEADRNARIARYAIAMGIRVLCLFLCVFLRGWWLLLPALGAIFLPYVAVVLANNVSKRPRTVERPGAIVPSHAVGGDTGAREPGDRP